MIIYSVLTVISIILLAPYFLYKMVVQKKYLKSFKHRFLPPAVPGSPGAKPVIWVHAVSVGEVEAAHPVIRKIREEFPNIRIILSTVTETGQEVARKKIKSVDEVFYFPLDLPIVIPVFLNRLNPDLVLLTETEIWPYFIKCAKNRSIPVILINGRISSKSFPWYKRVKIFLAPVLRDLELFLMQSATDADKIIELGAPSEKVLGVGNIKFDQVLHGKITNNPVEIREKFGIDKYITVIVAGSTHAGEEKIFLDGIMETRKKGIEGVLPVIAPRHLGRVDEIESLLARYGIKPVKRSEYLRHDTKNINRLSPNNNCLILDTMGELSQFYSIAHLVFMGGSFVPVGGHNILEPAVFGVPVCFGPHMWNFDKIRKMFLENNAANEIHNPAELGKFFVELLETPEKRELMGGKALKTVENNRGVTDRTFKHLEPWIRKNMN